MYTTSQGDVSSDDKTASTSEAFGVLQSHFDCGGGDLRSTGGIPMETRSRRLLAHS